jgi:hypothetical protein
VCQSHIGLVGVVQFEVEVSEHPREGEVELCVGEAVVFGGFLVSQDVVPIHRGEGERERERTYLIPRQDLDPFWKQTK